MHSCHCYYDVTVQLKCQHLHLKLFQSHLGKENEFCLCLENLLQTHSSKIKQQQSNKSCRIGVYIIEGNSGDNAIAAQKNIYQLIWWTRGQYILGEKKAMGINETDMNSSSDSSYEELQKILYNSSHFYFLFLYSLM